MYSFSIIETDSLYRKRYMVSLKCYNLSSGKKKNEIFGKDTVYKRAFI